MADSSLFQHEQDHMNTQGVGSGSVSQKEKLSPEPDHAGTLISNF